LLPPGLVAKVGKNKTQAQAQVEAAPQAVALPHKDNYIYSGPREGTRAELLVALSSPSNWAGDNAQRRDWPLSNTIQVIQQVAAPVKPVPEDTEPLCRSRAYEGSVRDVCGTVEAICQNALEVASGFADRQAALCADNGACAGLTRCVEQQQQQHGCQNNSTITANLAELRRACKSVSSRNFSSQCEGIYRKATEEECPSVIAM
jgi:hypothetical protein